MRTLVSISTHAKKLADCSKKAYISLSKIKDKLQNYLKTTSKLWSIQIYDALDVFIQVYANLSYLCYINREEKSLFNWEINNFTLHYSHLFVSDTPIPLEILESLIHPIQDQIFEWDPPTDKEKRKSSLFYGYYLRNYKPEIAKDAGVVYTPIEIVNFMVKSISDLCESLLKIENGLKNPNFPYKIVDPAVGTMNFITGLIQFMDSKQDHIKKKILTLEISEIPYLLGFHAIISRIGKTTKNHFYFMNALTQESYKKINKFLGNDEEIISIILGNPPYYINTQNNLPWIREEINEYKKDLQEKNLKILSDDYVKFIRLSHKLFQNHSRKGIIAFITNNNFLDGSVFKIMRKSLMGTFSKIFIVNLHGNFRKNETGNPFKIKVGVCITFMVKSYGDLKEQRNCEVYYWDLPQSNLNDKYSALSNGFNFQNFIKVESTPEHFFIPRDIEKEQQYFGFVPINKLFKTNPKSGIMTGRDSLVSNPDRTSLRENMELFFQNRINKLEYLKIQVKKTKTWDPIVALDRSSSSKVLNSIIRYNYRGFIQDYLIYDKLLVDGCRMGYLDTISRTNPAICVTRSVRASHFSHALVVKTPPEKCFLGVRDSSYVFLLRSPKNQNEYNVVSPELNYQTTPEQIFSYIYGILYSPSFRSQYKEQLRKHFPRIPFPKTKELFEKMADIGEELIKNHLDERNSLIHEFEIKNKSELVIDDYFYDYSSNTVYFNTKSNSLSISGISPSMWEFEIGSVKQLEYWLRSRRTYKSIKNKNKRHIGLTRPLHPEEFNEFIHLSTRIRSTLEMLPKLDTIYKQIIAEIFKQSEF